MRDREEDRDSHGSMGSLVACSKMKVEDSLVVKPEECFNKTKSRTIQAAGFTKRDFDDLTAEEIVEHAI